MKRYILFVIVFFLVGCNQKNQETGDGLVGLISYKYTNENNIEFVQEFHKTYEDNVWQSSYNKFVVSQYDSNDNMIEQITYDIEDHDTIFHDLISQKFDEKDRLIQKIDSTKMLKIANFYDYHNNKLIKSSNLIIYSQRDSIDKKLWIAVDSSREESTNFYKDSKCMYRKVLSWDSELVQQNEILIPDTMYIYNYHDKVGNIIKSISLFGSDTFRIENRIYDDRNNVLSIIRNGPNDAFNGNTYYKYDKKDNIIEEMESNTFFTNRTETVYNDLNKPTNKKWIKLK